MPGTFGRTSCQNAGGTWSNSRSTCTITTTNTTHTWQPSLTVTNGTDVECGADQPGTGTDTTYPTKNSDNTATGGVYSSVATDNWWQYGTGRPGGNYIIYSANYLNYYVWAPSSIQTRLSTVQNAATGLLGLLSGVNVGLMTYSYGESSNPDDASGGMVRDPVQSIDATGVRASLIQQVNSLQAAGYTPLSETLFEAYRYFSGGPVLFGGNGSNGTFASKICTSASGGSCNTWQYFPSVASFAEPRRHLQQPGRLLLPEELHRLPDGRIADHRQPGRPVYRRQHHVDDRVRDQPGELHGTGRSLAHQWWQQHLHRDHDHGRHRELPVRDRWLRRYR